MPDTSPPDLSLGDVSLDELRREAHALVDWIADHLGSVSTRPVLARVRPGEIAARLPSHAPETPEPFDALLADLDRIVVPGLTHWTHPGFLAYFPVGFSAAGVLGDFVSTALGQQAMLWRTSPVATELEEVVLRWLRDALGIDPRFEGVIYDTASTATLHALATAREMCIARVRQAGLAGRDDVRGVRVYCSEHAHSSVDKAVIVLGIGHDGLRKIPADESYRMRPDLLRAAIAADVDAGLRPIAVVATVGTTSSTSVDPVPAIADVCEEHGLWLHVDAAYGGAAALLPECRRLFDGIDRAHSFVVNPHKWLFTPFDLSVFYCREMTTLRAAFSLVPEYLRTSDPGSAKNLMDTGFQLGRRFRAIKLWFVLRQFGLEGLRRRLREHLRLARLFAEWVDADSSFVRVAPVPFSVVCFRAVHRAHERDAAWLDRLNESTMNAVNAGGEVFLSHTRLNGFLVLRVAIGNLQTTESHLERAWALIRDRAAAVASDLT